MDFAKLCAERYSLRKFDTRPVEREKLDLILEAGRNAPTAHNKQPQRIFVLQSAEALEKADWMNPRDKNGPAYRVLARAARDKALPLAQWQKLHDEYYERTKR